MFKKLKLTHCTAFFIFTLSIFYFFAYVRLFSAYPFDDSYIHMRIARNFIEGGEPYFNHGEAVMATSSLLWTMLVSALFKLFGPDPNMLPPVALVLVSLGFITCAYILNEQYGWWLSLLIAFLIVVIFLLPASAGLMETPAAILLFLLSVISFKKARYFSLAGC